MLLEKRFAVGLLMALVVAAPAWGDELANAALEKEYVAQIRPVITAYCADCHSAEEHQGELDLARFTSLQEVRRDPSAWQKVAGMLELGEMPPKDAMQPSAEERMALKGWVKRYLDAEALSKAGDPGPVPLRRLSNAEYTWSIRDLTGVPLDPAREFPVDGAAGEGFTNAAAAGSMSPALMQKYFDAAKEIASHAVLTPTGIRFSESTSRRDWTEEILVEIRGIYDRQTTASGGSEVNLQGIRFETNGGGRLPLEAYLEATLQEREALRAGRTTIKAVARDRSLNARYLGRLWQTLEDGDDEGVARPSLLLDQLRNRWRSTSPMDAEGLVREIDQWQRSLFRFASIGHIGKAGGPKAWMESISPLASRQEIRHRLKVPPGADHVTVALAASDAGDGNDGDFVVWEQPRLAAPGRPDILLRDLRQTGARLEEGRRELLASLPNALAAADQVWATDHFDLPSLAAQHHVQPEILAAWFDYLGLGRPAGLGTPISRPLRKVGDHDFVRGWGGDNALSVVANSSDQQVRIPGTMPPHSVAVHPAPTIQVGIGWKCVKASPVSVETVITHAHPECGNGVAWSLEVRRGHRRQQLAAGTSRGATPVAAGKFELLLRAGDALALVISPRDGNHSCDLTTVDMTIRSESSEWNLSREVSPDILAANPHADSAGRADVWHFFSEPAGTPAAAAIPSRSILDSWLASDDPAERSKLVRDLAGLIDSNRPPDPGSPDGQLYAQITSPSGPLSGALLRSLLADGLKEGTTPAVDRPVGVAPELFGRHPDGTPLGREHLCVQAPAAIEVRIPAALAEGAELVTSVALDQRTGQSGSVQAQVLEAQAAPTGLEAGAVAEVANAGAWTASGGQVVHASPILAVPGSPTHQKFDQAFADFRELFPPALCYSKIVPVDEVVTLTLFHREDEPLRRLMLNDEEAARLDALWDELHFVSRDPLTIVDGFQQLLEFASQDGDPKVFEPLRQPIMERAAAFRKQLTDAEPRHTAAALEFAGRAWRRPLTEHDQTLLLGLYGQLRTEGLPHEEAIRLLLARLLIAPDFLYRLEQPPEGPDSGPISDHELATRLSYFLWSSIPDAELRKLADAGQLRDPGVLASQAERMLKDDRVRRLATEFACQWLQVYDFDKLDEKSERHFPEFRALRNDLSEEVIRYFTFLFQENRSVREIYHSDYTFANARLAKFYGFEGEGASLEGEEWRRISRTSEWGRGGILTQAAILAKQSGASRTSPILRGIWVSEVLLGERLPKPPKDVPPLPEEEQTGNLTVRQLVERHTRDERCARCHVRIDPFGFAFERFDAIGRRRNQEPDGQPIDDASRLQDGTEIKGVDGLRRYLLGQREDVLIRQFCRKLLGYALGRSIQLSDEPLLEKMQQELREGNFRFATATATIVRSPQFRHVRGQGDQGHATSAGADRP